MKKRRDSQKLDPLGAIKGILELLTVVLPPLLLFVLMEVVVYQLLFFMPAEWRWQAVGESSSTRGTLYVDWDARTLLTLLVSIPLTFVAYVRIGKAWRRWRRGRGT